MASPSEDPVNLYMNLDNWRVEEDDDDQQIINNTQSSETYLVGFVLVNVVGIQHYTGTINGREMVGLVREPLNPFDANAIKVLNMRTIQVGHVDRRSAAVLAPLIDSNVITVEGIVPKLAGGMRNRFKIPCQIHVFSKFQDFDRVKETICSSGLVLISSSDASFSLSESLIAKEKKKSKEEQNSSIDEIFKLVGASSNSSQENGVSPVETLKSVIKSELFSHQKEGLGWLIQRENSTDLPPFWEEKRKVLGGKLSYVNVLTNFETDQRPEPLQGGIFADDMGLGKTLTLLSLIATNTSGSRTLGGQEEGETSSAKHTREKKSKGKQQGQRKKRKLNDSSNKEELGPKTTLIVCPPAVFSSWISQLSEHTIPGSFKVYMYYGTDRTTDVEELQKFDLVLTTYSTLAAELTWDDSPVKMIKWFRVILDEAHLIKNAEARQSKAVIALKAKRRWAVTGTPIQNGSLDLFSLMAFLKFEPFSTKHYWLSLVQRPLTQGDNNGLSRLQILIGTISLRRVKDNNLVGLPPKTLETCLVELSTEEREKYEKMEVEVKTVLQNYIHEDRVKGQYLNMLSVILRLCQICDDVALCPSDVLSLLPADKIVDVKNNPELLKKLVIILQDSEEFDCPICICPPTNVIITCCAHIFCRPCILKALKRLNANCPLCRHPLSESDLFSAPPEASDSNNTGVPPGGSTSSKVSALLKLLTASRKENPSTKSVVFSRFTKMLSLLEEPLKTAGFRFMRLDGSLSAKKRAQIIEEFGQKGPDAPTVLLASLKASGVGINLTTASRVYLLEPWWNPAVEEQAMDRVHRIGQKEDVKIVRLIVKDSIEERILKLQDQKRTLAREAFKKKGKKDERHIGVEDLRVLMSL